MSKDLANRLERDLSASEEVCERVEDLRRTADSAPTPANYEERIRAARTNDFAAAEVESWDELWRHYDA